MVWIFISDSKLIGPGVLILTVPTGLPINKSFVFEGWIYSYFHDRNSSRSRWSKVLSRIFSICFPTTTTTPPFFFSNRTQRCIQAMRHYQKFSCLFLAVFKYYLCIVSLEFEVLSLKNNHTGSRSVFLFDEMLRWLCTDRASSLMLCSIFQNFVLLYIIFTPF